MRTQEPSANSSFRTPIRTRPGANLQIGHLTGRISYRSSTRGDRRHIGGRRIIARQIMTDLLKTGHIQSADGTIDIDLDNGTIKSRSGQGCTELKGETILAQYFGDSNDSPLSGVRLSANTSDETGNHTASLEFLDKNTAVLSSLVQNFRYMDDGTLVAEPLTSTDLRVNSTLEVANAIVYDKIQLQRKSGEAGNTGVDFVITGG